MGQCGNAALCSSIALRLRLTHAVARRGNVDNGGSLSEMRSKEFGEVEWSRDSHAHGVLKLFIATFVNALHQRQGIVDKIVHMTVLPDDLLGKPLQHLLVRYIAHKQMEQRVQSQLACTLPSRDRRRRSQVLPLLLVNDADMGTSLLKLFGNTTSDALYASRHDCHFILESIHKLSFCWVT